MAFFDYRKRVFDPSDADIKKEARNLPRSIYSGSCFSRKLVKLV